MMAILCASGIVLVLVFKDLKPLYRQDKKMFYVYAVILSLAIVMWLLYGLGVKVPSPAQPLKELIKVIYGLRG